MKRILIITANYTGYGHKSICEALCEQLADFPDVVIQVVDGFSLIGSMGIRASKLYGPITRNASDLWKLTYNIFDKQTGKTGEDMLTALIYERCVRKLRAFEPGLILSVHPLFNRSILNILKFHKMHIPFVALQADIINIHRAWCDARATLTLSPTPEAYECSMNMHGMPEAKLELCGFPTRARFTDLARTTDSPTFEGGRPINLLLMSGGEGSGNLMKYAVQLLKHTDANLMIICGRNKKLVEEINEQLVPEYGERVQAFGFLTNVQDYMIKADLVIARGSPNTMMEAVVLGVPLMITGSLPGQEADNPALMISHNLGILCETPESAPSMIKALMSNNGKRLREIREAQREYRNLDNAKLLAKRLCELALSADQQKRTQNRLPATLLGIRYPKKAEK